MKWFFPVFGGLIVLFVVASYYDVKNWQRFKETHECVKVSQTDSTLAYNFSDKGGFIVVPGKTGWYCNDGVTYHR